MSNVVNLTAWVDDVDLSTIDTSDLSPTAMQKLIESIAPSLQTLVFNIIISLVIFIVGKKLISFLVSGSVQASVGFFPSREYRTA